MIDWCPQFSKSRPIDVSYRLLISYYVYFRHVTWFENISCAILLILPVIDLV